MPRGERIRWIEPYPFSLAESWRSLREIGLLRPRTWARILGIVALVIGVMTATMVLTVPGVQIPWAPLLVGFAATPAFMFFAVLVQASAPRFVEVRPAFVQWSKGQSGVRIEAERILGGAIDDQRDPPLLLLEYNSRRGRPQTVRIAIGRKVDLTAFRALFDRVLDRREARPRGA